MRLSKIAFVTMMALSMTTALGTHEASANEVQRTSRPGRTTQLSPVQLNPVFNPSQTLAPQLSTTGQWTGTMHYQGDDVLAHYELSISGNQGTWQILGANSILSQGNLTTSVSGNQVAMHLVGSGMNLQLEGVFQNAGTRISGNSTSSPGYVFSFTKN